MGEEICGVTTEVGRALQFPRDRQVEGMFVYKWRRRDNSRGFSLKNARITLNIYRILHTLHDMKTYRNLIHRNIGPWFSVYYSFYYGPACCTHSLLALADRCQLYLSNLILGRGMVRNIVAVVYDRMPLVSLINALQRMNMCFSSNYHWCKFLQNFIGRKYGYMVMLKQLQLFVNFVKSCHYSPNFWHINIIISWYGK